MESDDDSCFGMIYAPFTRACSARGDICKECRRARDRTPAGEEIRAQIKQFIDNSGPDTIDLGIELDLRYYEHSPLIYHDGSGKHQWDVQRYISSTRPGCRAPHVFLKDGETSTYDLFGKGPEWTLINFINGNNPDQEETRKRGFYDCLQGHEIPSETGLRP